MISTIKYVRELCDLSVTDLAKILNVPSKTLTGWEKGLSSPTAYVYNSVSNQLQALIDNAIFFNFYKSERIEIIREIKKICRQALNNCDKKYIIYLLNEDGEVKLNTICDIRNGDLLPERYWGTSCIKLFEFTFTETQILSYYPYDGNKLITTFFTSQDARKLNQSAAETPDTLLNTIQSDYSVNYGEILDYCRCIFLNDIFEPQINDKILAKFLIPTKDRF